MSYQDDNYRDNPSGSQSDRDRYDDRYQDDRDQYEREGTGAPGYPGQPAKKGCSKGCLIGVVGCGCVSVLAVVGLILGMIMLGQRVINGMSTDPVKIRAATREIADINPPKGFEPKLKMDALLAQAIFYESKDQKSKLTLLQIHPWLVQKDPQQNREAGRGFHGRFADGEKEIKVLDLTIGKSEEKDIQIRGQVCKVRIAEAKDPQGAEYRLIDAEFKGNSGPVELQLDLPLEKYDEAEVTKFLESIK